MLARNLYDNKLVEVNKSPLWLEDSFNVEFYYLEGNICYGLKVYDSNIGALQNVTYYLNHCLYVSSVLMTLSQFNNLKTTHLKCDGYKKISLF
jgi:hypothetical protein